MVERATISAIRKGTELYLRLGRYDSRFVDTAAGRVHLLDVQGRGPLPPVVLCHGLGSRATDYLPLIRALRPHVRRLIAPDMPGHGRSWTPEPRAGSRPVRESMLEALDHVLGEPAVLFGNSLGGLVAIRYALERPERALGLMLANPGGAPIPDEELSAMLSQFRFGSQGEAARFIDQLTARPTRAKPLLAWGIRRRMARRGTRQLIERIDRTDLLTPEELSGLRAPVFLFYGREERILPDTNRRFFLDHLPAGARIEEPAGYGHAPFLDDLEGFVEILRGFVLSVGQGRRPRSA